MPTPSRSQPRDDVEEALDFALGQRRGRLVHDERRARRRRAPCAISTSCCSGMLSVSTEPIGVDRRADARQQIARVARGAPSSRCGATAAAARARTRCSRRPSDAETAPAADRSRRCRARARPRDRCRDSARPPTDKRAAIGRTAPVITLISVDLPAPFSPTSAWTSPSCRSNDTPSARARRRTTW